MCNNTDYRLDYQQEPSVRKIHKYSRTPTEKSCKAVSLCMTALAYYRARQ